MSLKQLETWEQCTIFYFHAFTRETMSYDPRGGGGMYKENRTGPRMKPWGTPQEIVAEKLLNVTENDLFLELF